MRAVTAIGGDSHPKIDVTIVMPCLNEASWLPACVANAKEALEAFHRDLGFSGEIIVADNGSTDGSQLIARAMGVRVVDVERRGYGAALVGGLGAAGGTYLVMGDADGSYDFRESVTMIRCLAAGADLCMGSRFKGRIDKGAMPWKNRYLGNPALTFILNLFFRAGISDAHCGLRALTKSCFERLELTGRGMEFASELIIKAALKRLKIVEVPVTLSRDLRDRPPHLRPWRDGWRHLRYLLMLSPWAFATPALLAAASGLAIWICAGAAPVFGFGDVTPFGNYWVILAGAMLGLGHIGGLLAAAIHLYGRRQGYRDPPALELKIGSWLSLEAMLLVGGIAFLMGLVVLMVILGYWSEHRYLAINNMLPPVIGTTLIVIGAQNVLGGFLLAVATGNDATFAVPESRAGFNNPGRPANASNNPTESEVEDNRRAAGN